MSPDTESAPPPALPGRRAELELIERELAVARSGEGRFIALTGPAGVGKTRLMRAAARRTDMLVLDLHAPPERLGPEDLLEEWLSPLFRGDRRRLPQEDLALAAAAYPRLAELSPVVRPVRPEAASPGRALAAIGRLVAEAADHRPLLFLADDLPSLRREVRTLVAELATAVAWSPVAFLATARVDGSDGRDPLRDRALMPLIEHHFLRRIEVQPLDAPGMRELIASELDSGIVGDLAPWLHAKSGGNALFAVELIRTLESQGILSIDRESGRWRLAGPLKEVRLPETIAHVLDSRRRSLPPELGRPLHLLALLGPDAPAALLASVMGVEEAAADGMVKRLLRAGVLERRHKHLAFAHPLMAEHWRHELSEEERLRTAALALDTVLASVPLPDGRRALARGAEPAQVPGGFETGRCATGLELATTEEISRILLYADLAARPDVYLLAALELGRRSLAAHRSQETAIWARRSTRRLVRVADPAARRWCRSQLDLLMGTALGRLPSAEARLRRFIRTPESGDLDSGIQAFSRLGQLLIKRSRWEDARPVLEAGLAKVAEVSAPGDTRLVAARCEMLCDLARVATLGDDLDAAQTLLQQADDALTGPDGEPPRTAGAQPRALAAGTERILLERAVLATRRGDYRKAIADFERLVELASLHPTAHVLRLQTLALNLARVGDVERARTVVLEALRRGKRIFDVDAESARWCYLGLIEALAGNWRDAAAAQRRARELAERAGAPPLWYLAMGELARARQVLDGDEASDVVWQEALAGTPAVGPPRSPQLFHLHWARSWILIRRRDWEGACDACAQSRAHLRAPHPINHAENELMGVEIEAGRIQAAKRAGEKGRGVSGISGASSAESLRAAAARLDALEPYLREQRLQNELVELARVRLTLAVAGLEVAPAETLLAEIATRLLEMGAGARIGDVAREFADTPIALEPRFKSTFAPALREPPVGRPAEEEEIGTVAGTTATLALEAPQFDRTKLRIHALGRLNTIRAGEEEPMTRADWGSRKARLLLAYFLAADPEGRGVSRDALCEAVWPDSESFTIDQTFRVTMNLLRKALRPAGGSVSAHSGFLVFKDGLYRLDQAMIWYDTREFDKALSDAAACEHQGQADAARERRRHAFDLYQGEFLSDFDETWIEPLREHYRSRVVEIGTSLATTGLAAGRFDEAQEIAERLVSSDPLSEAGHRLLIRAYLAAGQRDAAVRQLERCRSLLARELGLEVSRETAALLGAKPLPGSGTAPSRG